MPLDEERWEAWLVKLREFKSQSGHCDVPNKHPGGLGIWVNNQRAARKGGRLDPRRARKLEDEGFGWDVCGPAPAWDARLEELREFKREHGHCDVPRRHPGGLGRWVNKQRTARKGGFLDSCRARKLEDEGFRWTVLEDGWDARLEELREFRRESGHCDVPTRHPGGLGRWAKTQREARKGGHLDPHRARKLEDEGFRWEVLEDGWDLRLEELRDFQREHGHCNVPQKHPGGLGRWVNKQRTAHKGGHLDPRRIRKLEDEGFKWRIGKGNGNCRSAASGISDGNGEDGPNKRVEGAAAGSIRAERHPSSEKEGDARPRLAEDPKASSRDSGEQEHITEDHQRKSEGGWCENVSAHILQVVDECMKMYKEALESSS